MADPDATDPQRDAALAGKARLYPRRERAVGDVLGDWQRSADYQRLVKLRRARLALATVLPNALFERCQIQSLQRGTLTLVCADSILLAELRTMRHSALMKALLEQGSGVTAIHYKLAHNGSRR